MVALLSFMTLRTHSLTRLCSILMMWAVACSCMAQVHDTFADGDFSGSPTWSGHADCFRVNTDGWLQSRLSGQQTAWLCTPSTAIGAGTWQFDLAVVGTANSSNYCAVYLASDTDDLTYCHAYYVKFGGTRHDISLCWQDGSTHHTLISGPKDLLNANELHRMTITATRAQNGQWALSYQTWGDTDPTYVGDTLHSRLAGSAWCGILVNCTSKRGNDFYFDNISIDGSPDVDLVTPDNPSDRPGDGQVLPSVPEQALAINELMFDAPADGSEYVEIINRTASPLDVSGLIITTRKANGSFNRGNVFPDDITLMDHECVALTDSAVRVRKYHQCPDSARIVETKWRQALPNGGATVYLLNPDSTILDSVSYTPKMHHPLIKQRKGVALERIHPELPSEDATTWHSSASEHQYGTPGMRNSQYRSLDDKPSGSIRLDPEAFSPDGDGYQDVCLIHYQMPENGYAAVVRVYTPSGLRVATIADGEILSTEGVLVWDGMTEKGRNATIGIYALMFEAYNAQTGRHIRHKVPVVVTGR